eukprot:5957166-Ditylum_brightwellii.AAC.1
MRPEDGPPTEPDFDDIFYWEDETKTGFHTEMALVDSRIYIQSSITNGVWKTSEEILTRDDFTKAYDIK